MSGRRGRHPRRRASRPTADRAAGRGTDERVLPEPRGAAGAGRVAAAAGAGLLAGTALFLPVGPGLALLHELAVLATARTLGELGRLGEWAVRSGTIPLDPIYTGTLFYVLSDIQVEGVAVVAPVGAALHQLWPAVFGPPELVAGPAVASAIVQPGPSVLARVLADLSGDCSLLLVGLGLAWLGRPTSRASTRDGVVRLALFTAGALIQAHVVLHDLMADSLSLDDLEAAGLTYGVSVLFTGPAATRPRLSALLLALPPAVRDALLGLVTVALAYLAVAGLLLGPWLVWRAWRLLRPARGLPRRLWGARAAALPGAAIGRVVPAGGVALFALGLAASPLSSLADSNSRVLEEPTPTVQTLPTPPRTSQLPSVAVSLVSLPQPPALGALAPQAGPPGPSRVTVEGSAYDYRYRVNGELQVIRGMGYNPTYVQRAVADRADQYGRDFAAMEAAGVNTILGWETAEFDGLLLDRAAEHGIGVILPYHLDPALDYTDPAVREAARRDVLSWVRRYKEHPALRLWGPGNEVLHKLIYPSWMQVRGDPALEERAEAFSSFFVDLVDEIHALDPDHPITYRAAEDAYLPPMQRAFARRGAPRPWFVYGINIYTPRLADVIAQWPRHGLDAALLISEFGPGGAGPADRPRGYWELWNMIRARPERVIGGAPYVWFTEGPEEVDRIFGLVDSAGQPVDGTLAAIGRLYRGETFAAEADGRLADTSAPCDPAVLEFGRRIVAGLQQDGPAFAFPAITPPNVMGQLDNLPPDPPNPGTFRVEEAADPVRLRWLRSLGFRHEWWVSWAPPSRPSDLLGLLVRDRGGAFEVAYAYHGVGAPNGPVCAP